MKLARITGDCAITMLEAYGVNVASVEYYRNPVQFCDDYTVRFNCGAAPCLVRMGYSPRPCADEDAAHITDKVLEYLTK
jgi:hypothetical protein